jgi:hypothetical protein
MPRNIPENNQLPYMKSKKRENPSQELEYIQTDTKKNETDQNGENTGEKKEKRRAEYRGVTKTALLGYRAKALIFIFTSWYGILHTRTYQASKGVIQ